MTAINGLYQLALLGLMCASLHWLLARSSIGKPLWSRATGWVDKLLRCPACSGWWLGLALGIVGMRPAGHGLGAVIASGLLGVVLTPTIETWLLWGLERSAIDEDRGAPSVSYADPNELYNAICDRLVAERDDLSPKQIQIIGETIHGVIFPQGN